VLSTQQVVGKLQTTEHIKTGTGNANSRDYVVVHRATRLTLIQCLSVRGNASDWRQHFPDASFR